MYSSHQASQTSSVQTDKENKKQKQIVRGKTKKNVLWLRAFTFNAENRANPISNGTDLFLSHPVTLILPSPVIVFLLAS